MVDPDAAQERYSATSHQILGLWLDGRLSGPQALRCMRALRTGDPGDLLVMLFGAVFLEAQLETQPRALAAGADPWELLLLGVHGRNCEGEDLAILDLAELQHRMEAASSLGQERPTPWLRNYAARLVEESRRRRGAGTH